MLIKNALIYTMEETEPFTGDILIRDGKIAQIGKDLEPDGTEVLDATGLVATPGLVDAHLHTGGGFADASMDLNEMTDPVTPQMDAVHGIDINSPDFKELCMHGVTTGCFIPGSGNVIGGTGFVAKTAGGNLQELMVRHPAVMKCALGGNPKGYGKRGLAPMTRMGVADLLREALRKAQDYLQKKEAAGDDPDKQPAYDAKCEALIPVLKREIPLKVHCEQFDMLTTIAIAKEFGCDYTIEHAWACNLYADELVEGGGSICFGPIAIPEGTGELTGGDVAFVKELDDRGLNVCLITDGPLFAPDVLLFSAGDAVRYGLTHDRALRMITINAAKALHVEDRLGSLAPGKDADVVLWRGVPALDTGAQVCVTVIGGKIVYQAD